MNVSTVHEGAPFADEASLWNAFQQGDLRAFELIYQVHAAALLSYGKWLTADHDLARDLVQDIFVDIWTRRQTLRDLHTIRYYLFRIMRNRLARLPRMNVPAFADEQHPAHDDLLSPPVEWLMIQQEATRQQGTKLQQAIAQLPDRQREAILLAFYDEFTNDEIAGIMGINSQSVVNHLNRALGTLRGTLSRVYGTLLLLSQLL